MLRYHTRANCVTSRFTRTRYDCIVFTRQRPPNHISPIVFLIPSSPLPLPPKTPRPPPHRLLSHTPPSLPNAMDCSASVCSARAPPSVAFPRARDKRLTKAVESPASFSLGSLPHPAPADPSSVLVVVMAVAAVVVVVSPLPLPMSSPSPAIGCKGGFFSGPVVCYIFSINIINVIIYCQCMYSFRMGTFCKLLYVTAVDIIILLLFLSLTLSFSLCHC